MKEYEEEIIKYDGSESTQNSSKSSNSAVTVLTNFTENSTMPIYKNIFIAFFVCLTFCVVVSLIGYYGITIGWNNFESKANPFWDVIYSMNFQKLTTDALLAASDRVAYDIDVSSYNKTLIQSYFGYKDYAN